METSHQTLSKKGSWLLPTQQDSVPIRVGPQPWPYIGNGIKRKPYPMFPYWQKRKILLSLLRPSPELIPCSDPAGKQLCLLLNWLKSRSSEEQSQSKEQQAGRRPGTEREAAKGRKAGPLVFHWGLALPDPSAETTAPRRAEGTGLLSMYSVWQRLEKHCVSFASLPLLTRCSAIPICLIHCLRA